MVRAGSAGDGTASIAWGVPNQRMLVMAMGLFWFLGCGINKSRLATEQLVASEAVDKAVATIDFSALSGKKVYFDTQYLDGINMGPNGNVKYVISSLRQQMMAYDLRLQVSGDVIPGSIKRDGKVVTFAIGEPSQTLQVKYVGKDPLPDTLIDRATAMATGKMGRDGIFVADTMLAKCASKYEKETAAGVQISKKSN